VWSGCPTAGDKPLLHLALEGRWARANDGQLQYRAKPESYQAQSYAIDTGKFAASHANAMGIEAYYQPGPLMFGMEYFFNQVSSTSTNNPLFHGGEIFATYLFTGERHPYNTKGAFFGAVSPMQTVFDGGPGAWKQSCVIPTPTSTRGRSRREVLAYHADAELVPLGQRPTRVVYGYGSLDRFSLKGNTQFFQTRLQLSL
jgi:phosphate-selective porin OprO/OprP